MHSKLTRVRVQVRVFGILLALVSSIAAQSIAGANDWHLTSPSGKVMVHVGLAGSLFYSVSFAGEQVIADSKLGLQFAGGSSSTGIQVKFLHAAETASDTTWSNPFGKSNPVRNHFKQLELAFSVEGAPVGRMDVIFRAYDNGAAFRYRLPPDGSK